MKKIVLIALLFALPGFSQSKKYQSLLWEISGNGLHKKSYIYGSMHVSDKVSYHLSDAFFKHLLAADYVATESDPATWLEMYDAMGAENRLARSDANGFYSRFTRKSLQKDELFPLFVNNSNIVNSLLSRTNETQKDYQEDTYLDMFIYQTGRKYKKKVIGLENAKTSMLSVMSAESAASELKDENRLAIMKLLKERSLNQAMTDFYREKNLDMLDSLYVLMTPASYHKALITDRNLVMLKSIDSIAKKGSLFAAVGAAHLPGKKGLVELLREKGYTVKPVLDSYTEKGQTNKRTIDGYFTRPNFVTVKTGDGMVSLPMVSGNIFNGDDIGTPDLANGGIINLKRLPTRNFLRKEGVFSPNALDSLFYENIPGNILQKKFYSEENYSVYDISNKTKIGNAQHYRYYVTPLEVVCVSMGGNGNYVRRFENEIYPNIKLKKYSPNWETVTPEKGGFSISVPSYFTMYGNRRSGNPKNIEINAYDANEKAYYFLFEETIPDNETLASTAFELKRIQEEFYRELDISPTSPGVSFDNGYESSAVLSGKNLRLKTVVNGQKYYLVGSLNASEENAKKFVSSFTFLPFREISDMKKFEDPLALFTIDLPEKENEQLFWKLPTSNFRADSDKKNLFKTYDKQYTFSAPSGKTVDLFAWVYHRYEYVESRDTLLSNIKRNILDNYNGLVSDEENEEETIASETDYPATSRGLPESAWNKWLKPSEDKEKRQRKAELVDVKESYDKEKQLIRFDVTAQRPDCVQAAKYVVFLRDGFIWYMRALVAKGQKEPDFIDDLIKGFTPKIYLPEFSMFDKKTAVFLEDVNSENDSIRYSAFESVDMLQLDKTDLPVLKDFLTSFDFKPSETTAVSTLLEKIGRIEDPQVVPFLESCYRKEGVNGILQLAIIRALAKQKSKLAYEKIAVLLEYDLPLSNNGSDIYGLFTLFEEDTQHSQILYPQILQYYGVSEYQDPIVEFTTQLIREKKVNPKKLKSYKKLLFTDARLDAKRAKVWKDRQNVEEDDYSYESPSESLKNYATLLYGFKSDKDISQWFSKIEHLNLPGFNLELFRLDLAHNKKPEPDLVNRLLLNRETKFATFHALLDQKSWVPAWSDEEIAASVAVYFGDDDNSKTELLTTKKIAIKDKTATLFFFKKTAENQTNAYSRPTAKLVTIGFLTNPDGKIDPKTWKLVNTSAIQDEAEISKQYDIIIDRLQNEGHNRATFGKQNARVNLFDSDSEEDY
ncbi:TraB/GumN family protein [Flavobacterium sp.]|uniref:TraB/GumN family protein n=1 Tax=Flavobacterium sp. TaxID=239 RepID=UPI0025B7FE04|nr:TraB/GumN family protein [Flavobacterium sp.]